MKMEKTDTLNGFNLLKRAINFVVVIADLFMTWILEFIKARYNLEGKEITDQLGK